MSKRRNRNKKKRKLPGFPLRLGSKTYYMTPPDQDGMRQLENWILEHRQSPLDIAKTKLDGLTPEQQNALLAEALRMEATLPNSITEDEYAAMLDTREGAAMTFWLMLRKNHPEVQLEDVESIVEQATAEEFDRMLQDRDKVIG